MGIYENHDWGLDEEMERLLNEIDLNTEKRVILTAGDKQYLYDNGQVYSTNPKFYSEGRQISKTEFKEQAEEIMINYRCNKRNDIIIE